VGEYGSSGLASSSGEREEQAARGGVGSFAIVLRLPRAMAEDFAPAIGAVETAAAE
jgi:hypothetical protein